MKELGDRFSYAYAWHNQNVDVCRPFDATAACRDGNCVSQQTARAARMLADRAISTPPGGEAGILSQVAPDARPAMAAGTVDDWARESWQVAHDAAYASALGDPCGPKPAGRVAFDEATIRTLIAPLRLQIARGGLRLARLLDEALAR